MTARNDVAPAPSAKNDDASLLDSLIRLSV